MCTTSQYYCIPIHTYSIPTPTPALPTLRYLQYLRYSTTCTCACIRYPPYLCICNTRTHRLMDRYTYHIICQYMHSIHHMYVSICVLHTTQSPYSVYLYYYLYYVTYTTYSTLHYTTVLTVLTLPHVPTVPTDTLLPVALHLTLYLCLHGYTTSRTSVWYTTPLAVCTAPRAPAYRSMTTYDTYYWYSCILPVLRYHSTSTTLQYLQYLRYIRYRCYLYT